jgi:hypothetical protein
MYGVAVIWHGGPTPATVYVGSGQIRDVISAARGNPAIGAYAHLGLSVTWASVPQQQLQGVTAHLVNRLAPLIPIPQPPFVTLVEVNLPW